MALTTSSLQLGCVLQPYLDISNSIQLPERVAKDLNSDIVEKFVRNVARINGIGLQALSEFLKEVSYTGQLPRSAYFKEKTFWRRFFTKESWDEWTENRTALGRVVDYFSSLVRGESHASINVEVFVQACKEAEQFLQMDQTLPEDYKRVYENLRKAMIRAGKDSHEELSVKLPTDITKTLQEQDESLISIERDRFNAELVRTQRLAFDSKQSFLMQKLFEISDAASLQERRLVEAGMEMNDLMARKDACERKRQKNQHMFRQLDHLVRVAMVDSDTISIEAQVRAQRYLMRLMHADEDYFGPKIKIHDEFLSKARERRQEVLRSLAAMRQDVQGIFHQLDRAGDHGEHVGNRRAPVEAAGIDKMRGQVA